METSLGLSREALEYTYQRNVVDFRQWSTDGRIKDSAIQGVLGSLVELGFLSQPTPPPTKYYDMTYVERAQQGARRKESACHARPGHHVPKRDHPPGCRAPPVST